MMDALSGALAGLTGFQLLVLTIFAPSLVLMVLLSWILIFSKNRDFATLNLTGLGVRVNISVGSSKNSTSGAINESHD